MGSDSPRSSRSINVRARNPAAPRCLVCSSSFARAGERFERELDPPEPALDPAGQGSEGRLDQPVDLATGGEPVLFGVVKVTARLGIGVGPAADDRQRDRAGRLLFDLVAGVSGPFGADLVELASQGRAMAGVAEEHGLDLAGRVGRTQHRHAVIDRSIGVHPEIDPAAVLQDSPVGREAEPDPGPTPGSPALGRPEPSSATFSIASVSSRV